MATEELDVTGKSRNEIKAWLYNRRGDLVITVDTLPEFQIVIGVVSSICQAAYKGATYTDGIKATSLRIVASEGTDLTLSVDLVPNPYNAGHFSGDNVFDLTNANQTVFMFENLTVENEIGSPLTNYLSDYVFIDSDVSAAITARSVTFIGGKVRGDVSSTGDIRVDDSRVTADATLTTEGDIYLLNDVLVSGTLAPEGDIIYGRTRPDESGDYYGLGVVVADREVARVVNTLEDRYTVNRLFGGGKIIAELDLVVTGTVTTTLTQGVFNGVVGNGSEVVSATSSSTMVQGHSTLNISGGTFASYVYAGAYGKGGQFVDGVAVVNAQVASTELNISGGTFNGAVFAGCGALNTKRGALTEVQGDTKLSITGEAGPIYINSNVYGGSMGQGRVDGDTTITLSGRGDNLVIAPHVYFSGSSQAGYGPSKEEGETYVSGERSLVFDGFTGDFTARMNNGFDVVAVTGGSTVNLTGLTVNLGSVYRWEFGIGDGAALAEDEACLDWLNGTNDFSGDTLSLTCDWSGDGALAVFRGTAKTLAGWDDLGGVSLNGTAMAQLADGSHTGCGLRLYREENTVFLAAVS